MPAKAKKSDPPNLDNLEACVHLKTLNQVSNSMQPLCECVKRDLILGKLAGICSVCSLYKKSNEIISEMYISDFLSEEKILWDEVDFYDVVKDKYSETGKFALEDDLSDEDDDEDDDEDEAPKRRRKKLLRVEIFQ